MILDTLLTLLEKRYSESRQPRKRLCKAVFLLYSGLENCHLNYLDFKANPTPGTLDAWANSVKLLVDALESVKKTLEIFNVDLYQILNLYSWEEFFSVCSFSIDDGSDYRMAKDQEWHVRWTETRLKSLLVSLELAARVSIAHNTMTDCRSPANKAGMDLIGIGVDSNVFRITSNREDVPESEKMRQNAANTYYSLLRQSGVRDHEVVMGYDKNLADLTDLDFHVTLKKFRKWIKKEFTLEEVFSSL